LAARVASFARSSDGFVKNTLTGGRESDEEAHGVRVSLDLQTGGNWRANIMLDHSKNRAGMRAHQGLGLFDPSGFANPGPAGPNLWPCALERVLASECVNALGYQYSADPYSEGYDRQDREHVDASGISLTLRREADFVFESISNYRVADREVFEDTDASPLSIIALDFLNDSWAFTQELRLSHAYDGGSWQAGAFGLVEELDTTNRYDTLSQLRTLGVGFIPDPNLFFFGPFRLSQSYAQRTESLAVFAQWDTELSDKLTATLGTRVTDESNEFSTQTRFNEVIAQPILSPLRAGKSSDTAFSWRAALAYEIEEGRLLYASVNRAFKSGYFNGGALFPFDAIGPVDPEFLLAYEAGIKWRASDRLEAKASAFFYDYSGLQDFTLRPSPPPTRQVLDSADADIRGLELSARALLPAGFSFDASHSLLDTKFVDFIDANGVQRSGNRLTASPKQAAVAALNWQAGISENWAASASLRANYRSLIYFDNTNSPLLSSPSRTIVGADLALSNARSGLTVRLTARNLGDKAVLVDALNIAEYGFLQQTYDPPRQIGMSVEQRF
jgi:iron complex outermembrane recepter protein